MSKPRYQAEIEARWMRSFWDLVRDFADQGLSRADTARALGLKPGAFRYHLTQNPDRDPFDPVVGIARQYACDTGESFRDACQRMAVTHTLSEAARAVGYTDASQFRRALAARGLDLRFRTRQRSPRSRGQQRVLPDDAALRYAQMRIAGVLASTAAAATGFSDDALRRRVQAKFPHLWEQALVVSRRNQARSRSTLTRMHYDIYRRTR